MWTGGVRVIVLDEEKKMLLVKQHHEDKDIWMVPGGGIEEGETAAEAVVREMKEETGLDVTVGPMIFHIEEVSEKRGQRFVNFFMATVAGGDMHLGMDPEFDAEHQVLKELKFLSREEIQALPHVYPEFLRDEVWELLDAGKLYDAFRIREPWKK